MLFLIASANCVAVVLQTQRCGCYELTDCVPAQSNGAINVIYSNSNSGHQLRLAISSQIEFVSVAVGGEVLFQCCSSLSQTDESLLLSSLFADVSNFSIDLFRTPLAPSAAPAFKVILPKHNTLPLTRCTVIHAGMMPMLYHPSCINVVKQMMHRVNFDIRSFWKSVLHQMCGQSEVADCNSLQRTLVSHAAHFFRDAKVLTCLFRNFPNCCPTAKVPTARTQFCPQCTRCSTLTHFRDTYSPA